MLISARGKFTGKKEKYDLIDLMNRSKKKFLIKPCGGETTCDDINPWQKGNTTSPASQK